MNTKKREIQSRIDFKYEYKFNGDFAPQLFYDLENIKSNRLGCCRKFYTFLVDLICRCMHKYVILARCFDPVCSRHIFPIIFWLIKMIFLILTYFIQFCWNFSGFYFLNNMESYEMKIQNNSFPETDIFNLFCLRAECQFAVEWRSRSIRVQSNPSLLRIIPRGSIIISKFSEMKALRTYSKFVTDSETHEIIMQWYFLVYLCDKIRFDLLRPTDYNILQLWKSTKCTIVYSKGCKS